MVRVHNLNLGCFFYICMLLYIIDMQNKMLTFLRKKLTDLYPGPREDLAPFLSNQPLIKGTVYTLRRKCSKPSCRCARGALHESLVRTATVAGKTRLWTIPGERIEEVRQGADRYRWFRQARTRLLKDFQKRQTEILRLIDALEKLRTQNG